MGNVYVNCDKELWRLEGHYRYNYRLTCSSPPSPTRPAHCRAGESIERWLRNTNITINNLGINLSKWCKIGNDLNLTNLASNKHLMNEVCFRNVKLTTFLILKQRKYVFPFVKCLPLRVFSVHWYRVEGASTDIPPSSPCHLLATKKTGRAVGSPPAGGC